MRPLHQPDTPFLVAPSPGHVFIEQAIFEAETGHQFLQRQILHAQVVWARLQWGNPLAQLTPDRLSGAGRPVMASSSLAVAWLLLRKTTSTAAKSFFLTDGPMPLTSIEIGARQGYSGYLFESEA